MQSQLKIASPFRILCNKIFFENNLISFSRNCRKTFIYILLSNSLQKVITDRENIDNQYFCKKSFELAKNQTFCDTVKLWIRYFFSKDLFTNSRQFDFKNLSRLIQIFKLENCLQLASEYYISIVIYKYNFDNTLYIDQIFFDILYSV